MDPISIVLASAPETSVPSSRETLEMAQRLMSNNKLNLYQYADPVQQKTDNLDVNLENFISHERFRPHDNIKRIRHQSYHIMKNNT